MTANSLCPPGLRVVAMRYVNGAGRSSITRPWHTIHVCGNMRFVYDGDNRAIGTLVLTVFMVVGEQASTTVPFSVGEDPDRFVRTEQGWRLTSRRWVELFARGDALNLP